MHYYGALLMRLQGSIAWLIHTFPHKAAGGVW